MMRWAVVAFTWLALAGCTHLSAEVGVALEVEAEQFLTGRTHYGEVLRRMGPPSLVGSHAGGFGFLYEYARVEERQLSLSPMESETGQLFDVLVARADLRHEMHFFLFDRGGVLRSQRRKSRDESLGSGAGVQLIVDVSNVVDTSRFRTSQPQHGWGRALLEPLPEALNRRHREEASQLGAPSGGIGQRTLEMREPD